MMMLASYLGVILNSVGHSTGFDITALQGETSEGSEVLRGKMECLKGRVGTWPVVGKARWVLNPPAQEAGKVGLP